MKLEDIPIVKKYLDVFPDDIFHLALDKNVKFTIDLILGITFISIALYRMTPLELWENRKYSYEN